MLPEKESLDLLRLFRDFALARSPLGRECVQFYYQNMAEISSLLYSHPALKRAVTGFVKELLPYLTRAVQEEKRTQGTKIF